MKDSELVFGLMAAFEKSEYMTSDLRYLTEPFGVSESSLRTCLFRMLSKGVLVSERSGKQASYRFADRGKSISRNVALSFRPTDYSGWDGSFWGVVFSVPEVKGEYRHKIRKKLIKYRFACMQPGFWIRPVNENENIPEALRSITGLKYCRLIKFCDQEGMTKQEGQKYWKTQEVNEELKRGVGILEAQMKKLDGISSRQALVKKMRTGDEIVSILFKDPLLPKQFLPKDWAGDELRKKFAEFDRIATKMSKPYWERIFIKE